MKNTVWASAGYPSEKVMRLIVRPVWPRATRRRETFCSMAARLVAGWLVLAVLASSSAMALPGPQQTSPDQSQPEGTQTGSAPAPQPAAEPLPDSPGAGRPQDAQNTAAQSGAAQSLPQPQQDGSQKPVGTAAAETATTTGFAASKPAGAALAPAKQKRTRTILISVGAIAGAAVALGLVVALSKGTPSKPPGSQ
jgi:hypothetical protein